MYGHIYTYPCVYIYSLMPVICKDVKLGRRPKYSLFSRRDGGVGYQSRGVCPNIFGRLPRLPVGAMMKIRPIKIEINGPGDSPREGYDKVVGSWRATDRHCTRSWPPRSRSRARGFNILIRFILKLLQVTIVLQITVQSAPRRGAYLPFSFPRP